MIVSSTSASFGKIMREITPSLGLLFLWNVFVTVAYLRYQTKIAEFELPLALFGTVLALFLGLRNNSAYARWWEARTIWGAMNNASRSFAREALTLIDKDALKDDALARNLIHRQIAYVQVVRCTLRDQDSKEELLRFLGKEEVQSLEGVVNIPNALLNHSAKQLATAAERGLIDSVRRVRIATTMVDIANAQGGLERIKRTPLPMQYRFLPTIFTYVFCLVLPTAIVQSVGIFTPLVSTLVSLMFTAALQIGDDLKDPFSNKIHDVPMTAMTRGIEIDLLQTLGEPAPEPLKPVKGVLM